MKLITCKETPVFLFWGFAEAFDLLLFEWYTGIQFIVLNSQSYTSQISPLNLYPVVLRILREDSLWNCRMLLFVGSAQGHFLSALSVSNPTMILILAMLPVRCFGREIQHVQMPS
nr:uncharacterized protein LOC103421826 isoform X5 [Malus domestica]